MDPASLALPWVAAALVAGALGRVPGAGRGALAAAVVAGAWLVGGAPRIPREATDAVPWLALLGVLAGRAGRGWVAARVLAYIGVLAAAVWAPVPSAEGAAGALAVGLAAEGLSRVAARTPPRAAGLGLGAAGIGFALALVATGSLRLGLLGSVLAGALLGGASARVPPDGLLGVWLLLALSAARFSGMPAALALAYGLAPLGLAAMRGDEGPVPWRSALAGLCAGLAGLALVADGLRAV